MATQKLQKAFDYLKTELKFEPQTALILGSGWDSILNFSFTKKQSIPYRDIPGWPVSDVPGHQGKLIRCAFKNQSLIVLSGRSHYYEGFSPGEIVFPIRILKSLGVRQLIITHAAGGINPDFKAGDIMLITDHLNFIPREIPDPKRINSYYDPGLMNIARQAASQAGVKLREGVYLATTGPSFETPAEIRMMRWIGADAVGMSTVPEVLTAGQLGLKVLGLSCIANQATGLTPKPLRHEEVLTNVNASKKTLGLLIRTIIECLS